MDSDDDNDGITDLEGGDTLDTDGDGIPNRLDYDSDGDGCKDVDEAGLSNDENSDGKVGILLINVNDQGLVTSTGNGIYTYSDPDDLDGNGVFDFLESGSFASVASSPTDVTVSNNGSAIFVAKGSSEGAIKYTWQVSTDEGNTFEDIETTTGDGGQSEIMIVGGGYPRNNQYRSFLEIYANKDIEANKYKIRLVNSQNNYVERNLYSFTKAGNFIVINDGGKNNFNLFFGSTLDDVYGKKNTHYNLNNSKL